MTSDTQSPAVAVTVASDLKVRDLFAALGAGWRDFAAYPMFGLFFAAFYVIGGWTLYFGLSGAGQGWWLIPVMAGFPLLAPFSAVGLYEVSRRREAGEKMRWSAVLGALGGPNNDQILMMGALIFIAFSFWMGLAHGVFAIFLGGSGVGASNGIAAIPPDQLFLTLGIGTIVGGLFALAMFAITVVSLPMLVDREVDFITAIITSLAAFRNNRPVMLAWALIIALLLAIGMATAFLGLLVILPVLGHASWHLYRRLVRG